MDPVTLAQGVVAMLTAAELDPLPELAFAPSLERDEIEGVRVLVAPGDVGSQVVARSGVREFSADVDVAVIAACQPDDTAAIETLLALCGQIGELLAVSKLGTEAEPVRGRVVAVDHEPLYDPARLRAGVFLGIVTGRYKL